MRRERWKYTSNLRIRRRRRRSIGRCGRPACRSAPVALPPRAPGGTRASLAAIAMGETSPCARGFEIWGRFRFGIEREEPPSGN
ncbi:hypothetical protein GQ55_1G438700 [Panicum hallii var. hallii]|uniref:Uncharacterized protein n=1 Tax=Panicum hallii var. hallii TaxID=1504633 RepID=A0A2T7FDV2_9POAL|nr:hypothetical protein GQ55_1G438700 [Panicum hallii var. hallii]